MSMIIAHNMSAINTKRQFATSARGQSGAMEKLSSGYKINTGKDDPSGLVISEKLRSQINGLKRAQQNTEEAINVMGIAEGALNEMNAILKKMKALAIHSNNTGVTSPDQIAADQAEMDSAIQTLDRIAQTTKFSDENLLNGSKDIAYERTTSVKGTQQNSLLNVGETGFSQIFKRDDYAVSISFTGTDKANPTTGVGEVDFTQQAMKAYLEVDTSNDPTNDAQIENGAFMQEQQFTLTGNLGSRAFTFRKGATVADMVSQIKSAADSTGIDAALVFNSDQEVAKTAKGQSTAIPPTGPINSNLAIPGLTSTGDKPSAVMVNMDATQKQAGVDNFTLCPGGAPGVELRLPLLFSEGFVKGRLSLPHIVRMCCSRPAEIFGLAPRKGDIRPGADADLVLFDPKAEWTVDRAKLHENVDYTPYQGMRLTGAPVATYSRGELVVENGIFKGEAGRGKYLRRE